MSDLDLCSLIEIAFKHNLCDELTRLHPKISFGPDSGHADDDFKVSAKPRKHEVIPTPDNKEKIKDNSKDTSDQIIWEEFLEKHPSISWIDCESMIGKTPSAVLWELWDGDSFYSYETR